MKCPTYCPCGVRCVGGVTSDSGSRAELETLVGDVKGKGTSGSSARLKVPMRRSGSDCSTIVVMKRGNARGAKGQVTAIGAGQPATGGTRCSMEGGSLRGGTSRMTREVSSPDVRPVKAGVFSRRQTCRSKSQALRSSDSRVTGNQDSEAYRRRSPVGRLHESPGRNNSERASGLESE